KDFVFKERFPTLYNQTKGLNAQYNSSLKNDPQTNWMAISNAFKNLKTVLGAEVLPVIIPYVTKFTEALQKTSIYLHSNPGVAKNIAGFFAMGSALLFSGAAIQITRAALMGLQFVFTPLGSVIKKVASAIGPLMSRFG